MKLYQYPAAFGLPCPSPFCTKAEVLLKMAGQEYEDVRMNDPRKGPKGKLPPLVRNIIPIVARRQVRGYLHGQGLGRHSREQVVEFARQDIDALATFLADKPFMMGETASGLDATAYAHLANIAVPKHDMNPLRAIVHGHANLMGYVERCRLLWFPDYASAAA